MAKQGMKRPDETPEKEKNKEPTVPEIQGKAKNSKKKANTFTAGIKPPDIMVYHSAPFPSADKKKKVSDPYPEIDTDLARDNLQNDIPEADLQDLK